MSTYILKHIFRILADHAGNHTIRVIFADTSEFTNYDDAREPDVTITFHTHGAQWWTILFLPIGLFDGYVNGTVDIEGDNPIHRLAQMGHAVERNKEGSIWSRLVPTNPLAWMRHKWCEITQNNINRERAIKNAEFHYSLPVELFQYKLGETVGYSEGYWIEGTQNINQAKHNLYEYICQKLQLKEGMTVLEVGSGWGFLPIYMVKNYGVNVVVYNPTKEQNEYMRERFKRHGVADKIRLEFGTHRDIVREAGTIDRFVSIGVHEHHGMSKRMYRMWWRSIHAALKDGGIGVISTSSFMDYDMTGYLTLKYIWPGGHIPSVPLEIAIMHEEGFMLVEWENLWPHYHKTLSLWRDRFKKYWPQIHASNPEVFDERFRRRWTMYLEAVPETFERRLDCSHFIFVKGRHKDAYPHTLEDRYRNARFRTGDDPVECYE